MRSTDPREGGTEADRTDVLPPPCVVDLTTHASAAHAWPHTAEYEKYAAWTGARLEKLLKKNKQLISGIKAEKIVRVVEGVFLGGLPYCPLCVSEKNYARATLKYKDGGAVLFRYCPGVSEPRRQRARPFSESHITPSARSTSTRRRTSTSSASIISRSASCPRAHGRPSEPARPARLPAPVFCTTSLRIHSCLVHHPQAGSLAGSQSAARTLT